MAEGVSRARRLLAGLGARWRASVRRRRTPARPKPSTTAALGAVVAAVALSSATLRQAAAAPLRAGVQLAGGYGEGAQARLAAQLELGLGPAWSWRLAAGPAYGGGRAGAQLLTGAVYAVDALRYVPRLVLLLGVDVPRGTARLQGGCELARTLGLHADVSVGAYATWRPGGTAGGLLAVGAAWEL